MVGVASQEQLLEFVQTVRLVDFGQAHADRFVEAVCVLVGIQVLDDVFFVESHVLQQPFVVGIKEIMRKRFRESYSLARVLCKHFGN